MPTNVTNKSGTSISETQSFQHNRWVARRTAAVLMIGLYGLLMWMTIGRGQEPAFGWLEIAVVLIFAAAALFFTILSRHPVTRLRVGPDGLEFPFSFNRAVAWHEIERTLYVPRRPLFWWSQEWLVIEMRPKAGSLFRIPLPFFTNRADIRMPLHILRSPSGDVLSSIERFMPVIETDILEAEAAHPGLRPS